MKKTLLFTALLVAALLTAWAIHQGSTVPGSELPATTPANGKGPAAGVELRSRRSTLPERERRPKGAGSSRARSTRVRVHGRCVTSPDARPVAGCRIRIRDPKQPSAPPLALAASDGEGRFAVAVHAALPLQLLVDGLGFAQVEKSVPAHGDVGVLTMITGARVRVTVEDEDGVPRPGVQLTLRTPARVLRLVSGPGGIAEVPGRLVPGAWSVSVRSPARLVHPRELGVPAGLEDFHAEITVSLPDPRAVLSGRVLLPNGQPGRNLSIFTVRQRGFEAHGYAVTDPEGRFRIQCRGRPGPPIPIAVPRAPGCRPFQSEEFAWGTTDIVLTLAAAEALEVELIAADSGKPILAFAACWFPVVDGRVTSQIGSYGRSQEHPEGIATLSNLPNGEVVVIATPQDPRYAPTEPLRIRHPERRRVQVQSQPRIEIPILVLDPGGEPVRDAEVELVRSPHGAPVTLHAPAFPPQQFLQSRAKTYLLEVDQAKTDARGKATVRSALAGGPVTLRIRDDAHLPVILPVTPRPDQPTVRVVLEPGATVRGSVRPPTLLAQLLGQRPDPSAGARDRRSLPRFGEVLLHPEPKGTPRKARVAPDGSFAIHGLPAGTWRPVFRVLRAGGGVSTRAYYKTFPTLETQVRGSHPLLLDIADMAPGSLRGSVSINGAPQAGRSLRLTRKGGSSRATYARTRTDPHGAFLAEGLQPGRYRLTIDVGEGPAQRLTSSEWVEVLAGQTARKSFALRSGRLRAHVADGDGKALAHCAIRIGRKSDGYVTGARTDARGDLDVLLELGTYELAALPDTPTDPRPLGTIRLTAGAQPLRNLRLQPK